MFEEVGAPRGKLQVTGRPLDEPAVEPLFEPLQLQADGRLRRPHSLGRAREAAELGNADEGPDGIQVKGALSHFQLLSLISIFIAYQNRPAAAM